MATGATWRTDGVGRENNFPVPIHDTPVFSPEQIMDGAMPEGRVIIFDDDHYYMASALAQMIDDRGGEVIFVTPAVKVASWTENTLEQHKIQADLIRRDIPIICGQTVTAVTAGKVTSIRGPKQG